MDALKRAEQEKREAARKLEDSGSGPQLESGPGSLAADQSHLQRESGAGSQNRELSLQPVTGEFPSSTSWATPESMSTPVPTGHEDATLNVTGEQFLSLQLNTSQPVAAPATLSPSGLADQIIPEEDNASDMTFHGLSVDTPKPAVPGMYENTMQGEMDSPVEEGPNYDETLPGVSAMQLARDIGTRDQPTPVAAETVFTAGRSKVDPGSGLKWMLGGLTLVMLTASGIWYYLTVTPVARKMPSPWVARGIESVPVAQGEGGMPIPVGGEIPGAVPVLDAVPAAPGDSTAISIPATGTSTPAIDSATVVPADSAANSPVVAKPVDEIAPQPQVLDQSPAAVAATPAAPAINTVAPALVRISRETRISDSERMVREAYALYQAEDLAGAQALYLTVLEDAPDNIDALLGYGAITLRDGETAKAVEAHGHVLRLDPDNDTALAVLVGLNKNADLNGAESAINTLIKESPEQPFLYFTLGNIYAAQQRWPESQQAFFDAHRLDSGNPDFALNLAISLDRIGQRQQALDYYSTALRLAEHRVAGFDPSAVLARIQSLSVNTAP